MGVAVFLLLAEAFLTSWLPSCKVPASLTLPVCFLASACIQKILLSLETAEILAAALSFLRANGYL